MKYNISIFCILLSFASSTQCASAGDIDLSCPFIESIATPKPQSCALELLNYGRLGTLAISITTISNKSSYPYDQGVLKPREVRKINFGITGKTMAIIFVDTLTGNSAVATIKPNNQERFVIGCAKTTSGLEIINFSAAK